MFASNSNSTVCKSQKLTLETRLHVHAKVLREISVVCAHDCVSVCECNDATRIV